MAKLCALLVANKTIDPHRIPPPAITCPELQDPVYGTVSVSGLGVGSVAMYKCNDGFQREGTATRICQITGEWSTEAPICKRE